MLPNHKTLVELAAAQQQGKVFAFSLGYAARFLAQLRTVHAQKSAELDALDILAIQTTPDVVLRSPDGSELTLRMPPGELRGVYDVLRNCLEEQLRQLEAKIVALLVVESEDDQLVKEKGSPKNDDRIAILALCQPADEQQMPSGD